jgi:hypothetical protein
MSAPEGIRTPNLLAYPGGTSQSVVVRGSVAHQWFTGVAVHNSAPESAPIWERLYQESGDIAE